jgi:rfaE bifunctional protein nucleotidyltransferase chain/domain/rfaE bifunctional protein kinase chain/domain
MRATRPLLLVGDALLDRDLHGDVSRLAPEGPVPVVDEMEQQVRPGGAGLAAALAAADGRDVILVTALSDDAAGRELAHILEECGVAVIDLGLEGSTPEKIRVRSDGRTLLRLDRGNGAGHIGPVGDHALRALGAASAVLVADYGRGMTAQPTLRKALADLAPRLPVVWDPHPRSGDPVPGMRLCTPNAAEAARFEPDVLGDSLPAHTERGRRLVRRWDAGGVVLTLGSKGALLVGAEGPPVMAPPSLTGSGDVCGAGDRFASALAGLLADGVPAAEAVSAAVNAAADYVARGGAAAVRLGRPEPFVAQTRTPTQEALRLVAAVRARGGTVVATGGCFDLLHAGHVAVLQQARALGDCLVVCLNSDASTRRLKGQGRPLNHEEDRAAVLAALGCVDAVVTFDEDTPEQILQRLRPDIFAKGADYAVAHLPEEPLLRSWGGQVVLLPYLEGRSTTSLVRQAAASPTR